MGFFDKVKDFSRKLYDYEDESYDEAMYEDSYETESYVEETAPVEEMYTEYDAGYQQAQTYYQQPVAVAAPIQQAATVVMLTPYDIRTSQIVLDHIKEGHIVICNLTANANNQRVVDYISGGVYMEEGKIEPTPIKTTFVCTPKSVNLIVDVAETSAEGTKVSAL